MNVCLISSEYPPETGWGGIGTHTYELAHGLCSRGHKVVVVARGKSCDSVCDDDGVVLYRIDPNGILRHFDRRLIWRFGKFWDTYNLLVAMRLRRIVKDYEIDLIEVPESRAEGFFLRAVCDLRRTRLVVKLHTGTYLNCLMNQRSPTPRERLTIRMERCSVRMADYVISPSQALIDLLRQTDGSLLQGKEAVVIRNAINPEAFRDPHSDDNGPSCGDYVLYSGRLETRKGVKTLFEIVPRVVDTLPSTKFLFLGADCGLKDPFLEKLPDRYRTSVIFLDHVVRSRIPIFYLKAAVCVFPSLWENFPYTCLEAMALGAAVIGSRAGGMAEMIEEGVSGFLVSPDSPDELAQKLLTLLRDKRMRDALGRSAMRRVREKFSSDVVVNDTVAFYRTVLGD